MKKILAVLIVLAAVPAGLYAVYTSSLFWDRVESEALTVLQRREMLFLVTDKVVTQVASTIEESNVLLGEREGVLLATVTMHYGLDLQELTPQSLTREGDTLVVTLPEPRELDFGVDPASMRVMTRRSALLKLADIITSQDMEARLREKLRDDARAFIADRGLLPRREAIVARLNEYAPMLTARYSVLGFSPVQVEFR